MPNGTFQIRLIFVKAAAKQRNSFPLSPQGRLAGSVVASGHNVLLELLRIYSIKHGSELANIPAICCISASTKLEKCAPSQERSGGQE